MRKIIGFTGKKGSGKSEAAKYLHAVGFTRTRFAGTLKAMMVCLGLGDEEIEGSLKEVPSDLLCGKTPRYAMQTIGTEWGRDLIGPSLWVNVWKHKALQTPDFTALVVEDVRFENEVEAVRSLGGWVVRVERPSVVAGRDTHPSEEMDFLVDVTINNNGTLKDLHDELDKLCLEFSEFLAR